MNASKPKESDVLQQTSNHTFSPQSLLLPRTIVSHPIESNVQSKEFTHFLLLFFGGAPPIQLRIFVPLPLDFFFVSLGLAPSITSMPFAIPPDLTAPGFGGAPCQSGGPGGGGMGGWPVLERRIGIPGGTGIGPPGMAPPGMAPIEWRLRRWGNGGAPGARGLGLSAKGHMTIVICQSGWTTLSHTCGSMISPLGPTRSNSPRWTCGPTTSTDWKACLMSSSIPWIAKC